MKKPSKYRPEDYLQLPQGKNRTLKHLKSLIDRLDWVALERELEACYPVGQSSVGRPAYPAVCLFKMCLLKIWYGLSDEDLEEMVNDRLSFRIFLGLSLDEAAPDSTTLHRFRKAVNASGKFDQLLEAVNAQLLALGVQVKPGTLVDATFTDTALGTSDPEAGTGYKRGQYHRGYKAHIATSPEGLIKAVVSTPANVHDSTVFTVLLKQVKGGLGRVYADKGYAGTYNRFLVQHLGGKDGIMEKAVRNKPLTEEQKARNKDIQSVRWRVEQVFGSWVRWFKGKQTQYRGLKATHGWHVMLCIAYNLKRFGGAVHSAS